MTKEILSPTSIRELIERDSSSAPSSYTDSVLAHFLYRELELFFETAFFFQGDDVVDNFLRSALGNKWMVYWQSPLTFSEISITVRENMAVRDWFLRRFGSVLSTIVSPDGLEEVIQRLENRFTVFEVPEGSDIPNILNIGDVEGLQVDKQLVELMKETNPWIFYFLQMLNAYLYVFGNRQLLRHGSSTVRHQRTNNEEMQSESLS